MAEYYKVDYQRYDGKDIYGKIGLIQLGRRDCAEGSSIEKHTHLNWFELTCIIEGEGKVFGADRFVDVKKGDIFLSFPCEVHAIFPKSTLVYDHLAFFAVDNEYKETLERVMAKYSNPEKRVFRNYRIRDLLDGSISEIKSTKEFRQDYIASSLSLITIELLKVFDTKRGVSYISDDVIQSPEKLCDTIKHYIDTHLFSINSLTELAHLCGYNYSYLSFLFKKVTGITLSDYYKDRRFASAKLMINENRLKIGEISNLLGYNSVYAFSKAFKDEFGVSPKKYFKDNCDN